VIKNSQFGKSIAIMWPFIRPYKMRALFAMLLTIPVGSMDALIALSLKPYMDVVLVEKSASSTSYIPIIIIAFSLIQSILTYGSTYLNTWVGSKITHDLKAALYRKMMSYEASFFDKSTSGEVQYRFNSDADLACSGLITNTRIVVTRVVSSISLIAVLFYNSWQLSIVAITILFLALYPLTTVRKKLTGLMNQTIMSGSEVTTHYNEAFSGNRIVTSYNLADHQGKKFETTLQMVFRLAIKMVQKTGIISPMMHFIIAIGIAAVIWMGSHLIVTNEITPGNFISFLTALIMLYGPVKGMGNNYNAVQMSILAIERVNDLLQREPAIKSKENAVVLNKVTQGIEYKDVKFAYTSDRQILKGVNLKVNVGETIALVGNSGGGKTTFVNLLPRFYEVTSGGISIDGIDVRDIDLVSLRDNISIVFQDNFLFTGTIKDNITLGQPDISEECIAKAVEDACLTEFIDSLTEGLDTEIGERGIMLSGGQKQRVAIARAFLKNAPIVILDEATSALDNKSEAVVQQAIANLMQDRTVFIIAHRLSTVRHADKIVVVNNGEIVEVGKHDELLANDRSVYASLYQTQLH
jgi:subfamily B ATP-binding cassette protein MsbA